MITNKKFGIAAAIILTSIVLNGCSKTAEPEIAKSGNTNQATVVNVNSAAVNTNSQAMPPKVETTTIPLANQAQKPVAAVNYPSPQIGSGANDLVLFTQARAALGSDQALLNSVIIDVKEGNVTLTGNVPSEAQKTKAAELIQAVKGIKSVKNNLRASS